MIQLSATVFVLALVATLAWLVRRGTLRLPGSKRHSMTIESATPLGERRSLVIVSVEGRRLLIGLTPMNVSLVTELTPAPPAFDTALRESLARPEAHS